MQADEMEKNLKEQFSLLLKLQAVDVKIDELEAARAECPVKIEAAKNEVEQKKQSRTDAKNRLAELQKSRKMMELEMESDNNTMKKNQTQLYELKSNEAYLAMQNEIAGLKEKVGRIEEEIIKNLMDEDVCRQAISESEGSVKQAEENLVRVEKQCADEIKVIEQKIAEEKTRQAEISGGIDEKLVADYKKLRENKGGEVIVRIINDNICSSCNINIRPQLLIEVSKYKKLVCCESCGRVLFKEDL